MRIRTIKPEWLDDERLVLASAEARVLSIALILLADDYGNGRANRTVLSARVFPGSRDPRETLGHALESLEAAGFVDLYEVDGQSYFSIRNWAKHQKVDHPSKPQVPGKPTDFKSSRDTRESLAKPRESLALDQDQEGTRKGEDQERAPEVDHEHVVKLYSRLRSEAHRVKTGQPGGTYRRGPRDWQPVEDLVAWAREQTDPAGMLEDSLRGFLADEWAIGAGWPISTWAKDPGRYNGRLPGRGMAQEAPDELGRLDDAVRRARLAYEASRGTDDRSRLAQEWEAAKAALAAERYRREMSQRQTRGVA